MKKKLKKSNVKEKAKRFDIYTRTNKEEEHAKHGHSTRKKRSF